MALSKKQIENVCLIYNGSKQCRYLDIDEPNKCNCLKLTCHKSDMDKRIRKYKEDLKKNGQDPSLMNTPIGDNCKGYPYLPTLKQGYDVKD